MLFKLCDGGGGSNMEGNFVTGQDGLADEGVLAVFVFVSWDADVFLCSRAFGASLSCILIWDE